MSFRASTPPELPMKNRRAYVVDLYLKDLLHGLLDLGLGGAWSHFENNGMLRLFHAQAFFRDDGPADHFIDLYVHAFPPPLLFFFLTLALGPSCRLTF